MGDDSTITTSRSLSVINFILGAWLIVSPYILNYATTQARWQQTVAGIIIAILAAVHYYIPEARWASWVNAVIALWLIIAPFATAYQGAEAFWNEIVTAVVVGALAIWNGLLGTSAAHGHRHGHAV